MEQEWRNSSRLECDDPPCQSSGDCNPRWSAFNLLQLDDFRDTEKFWSPFETLSVNPVQGSFSGDEIDLMPQTWLWSPMPTPDWGFSLSGHGDSDSGKEKSLELAHVGALSYEGGSEKVPYEALMLSNRRDVTVRRKRKALQSVLDAALTSLGGVSAMTMRHLHHQQRGNSFQSGSHSTAQTFSERMWQLPEYMHPSIRNSLIPISIGIYCLSTGRLYYLQRKSRYKDLILICGSIIGAVTGFAIGLDMEGIIFEFLLGFAWLFLVVGYLLLAV